MVSPWLLSHVVNKKINRKKSSILQHNCVLKLMQQHKLELTQVEGSPLEVLMPFFFINKSFYRTQVSLVRSMGPRVSH